MSSKNANRPTAAELEKEVKRIYAACEAEGLNASALLEAAQRRANGDNARLALILQAALSSAKACDNLPEGQEEAPKAPRALSAAEKAIQSALSIMDYLPKNGIKTANGEALPETVRMKAKQNLAYALNGDGETAQEAVAAIIGDIAGVYSAARGLPAPRYLQRSSEPGAVEVWTAGEEIVKSAAKEMAALAIAFAVAPWVDGIGRSEPKTPRQIRAALQKAKMEIEKERREKKDGTTQVIALNASPFSAQDGEFDLDGWERGEDMAIEEVPRNWKVWHRQEENKKATAENFEALTLELA